MNNCLVAFMLFITSFILGSLPFSVWVTRLVGKDPRMVGDKNPGATNALKAGGKWIGLAVLFMDVSKAAAPVGAAYQLLGIRGWEMAAISTAPILGHVFSPFLNFKGGKAVATALGVWIGLTLWDVPLVALAGIIIWFLLLKHSGWAVLATLACIGIYLYFARPDPLLFRILGLQFSMLTFTHYEDLKRSLKSQP